MRKFFIWFAALGVVALAAWHYVGRQIKCGADNAYWEAAAAHEPYLGVLMVSWVVETRREANRRDWGGNTTCGVVYKKHQFSWTTTPAAKRWPTDYRAYARALGAYLLVRTGLYTPPADLQPARFYMRPEHASANGRDYFKKHIFLKKVGHHYFYKEGHAHVPPSRKRAAGRFVSAFLPNTISMVKLRRLLRNFFICATIGRC